MFSMFNYFFFKKHSWLPPFAAGRQLCGPRTECPPVLFGVCVNQLVLLNLGKRGMIFSGPAPGADILCYQAVSKRLLSLFLLGQSPHGTRGCVGSCTGATISTSFCFLLRTNLVVGNNN